MECIYCLTGQCAMCKTERVVCYLMGHSISKTVILMQYDMQCDMAPHTSH